MKIPIEQDLAMAYKKAGGKSTVILAVIDPKMSMNRWGATNVDSEDVLFADLELLIQCVEGDSKFTSDVEDRRTLRTMKALLKLKSGETKPIYRLEVMAEALRDYLKPLPSHWLFTEEWDRWVPWFCEEIEYVPPQTDSGRVYTPAHIRIDLVAKRRGEKVEKRLNAWREQIGCVPGVVLSRLGIMPEDDDLLSNYEKEIENYGEWSDECGKQFLAVNSGKTGINDNDEESDYRWHDKGTLNFSKEGEPTKVVMNDEVHFGKKGEDKTVYVDDVFWRKGKKDADDMTDEELEALKRVMVPIQPFVAVFSLQAHVFAVTHISNLTPYEYDKSVREKLVLPQDHRDMLDILVNTDKLCNDDLVRGKRGGVVVLSSGEPGTGKTLTAEVYGEITSRPVYAVQCSQLGVTSDDLEKHLSMALRRSQRWNAILLIDEADVYIHERGNDVNQNAIVGVFLRLLEYYSGIMFLTTNRATVVDDAVHSRCLVHIRYTIPNETDRARLWVILSKQYGLTLPEELVVKLVSAFPKISGRNIKQLCRLQQMMTDGPSLASFIRLASFQNDLEVAVSANEFNKALDEETIGNSPNREPFKYFPPTKKDASKRK